MDGRTDRRTDGRTDGRTDDAKTISLRLRRGITKQIVKILMRRLLISGFPLFANVCPNLPDVRSYPTLPYHTLKVSWLVGCFVALRPKSTAMVIAGRSVNLTTLFPGQA